MSATVTGTIRLRVRGEPVDMRLSVPKEKVPLQSMMPVFQIMTDHLVHAAGAAEATAGKKVSCGPRCNACCRQLIPLAEVEAKQIAGLVARMPETRQSTIRSRFAELLARLDAEGLLQAMYDRSHLTKASLHDLGMRYLSLQTECPFLEDRNCSIHADRPLVCREHLVTSPAEHCNNPTAASIEKVAMPASVFGAVVQLQRTEDASSRFVPLPLALEWQGVPEVKKPGTEWLRQVMDGLSGKRDTSPE